MYLYVEIEDVTEISPDTPNFAKDILLTGNVMTTNKPS